MLDQDFKEFIESLNDNDVRYLIVGGYAVAFHRHSTRYGTIVEQYTHADRPLPVEIDGCAPQRPEKDTIDNFALAERLYEPEDLTELPDSVTTISLGCGNPVAIQELFGA